MLSEIKKFFSHKNKSSLPDTSKSNYNKYRLQDKKSSFCFAPSINMYFSWEGKVIACCFNQKYVLGKYPEQSLKEIWNGQAARELRDALKDYDLTKGCDICYTDIQHNRFEAVNALRYDEYDEGSHPKMLEFQLINTCNLQCIMFSGYLSSSIRKHREDLPEIPMKYDLEFVNQLAEFIPHLEYTIFSGGEPFLIDIYYNIWDKMIEKNPNCIIKVITNGTVINSRIKNLLSKGSFEITISIDSPIKEKYEKIRIGANYDKVIKNARYFSNYCIEKGTNFNLNFCPMVSNWQEIPSFIELCNSLRASLYFSIVYDPWYYSLSKLSMQELTFVYDSLVSKIEEMKLPDNENLKKLKLLLFKVKKWAADNNQKVEFKETTLQDIKELIFSKINQVEDQFDDNQIEQVKKKIIEVLNGFETKPIHEYLYYEMVEKSTSKSIVNSVLSQNVDEMIAEGLRNFNKKISVPKINISN